MAGWEGIFYAVKIVAPFLVNSLNNLYAFYAGWLPTESKGDM
jgi:hypothetical protein